jgi:inhibitor of cysteine peptidase
MKRILSGLTIVIPVIAACSALFAAPAFCESEKYNVKPGEELTIELKSNPSTGYSWEIARITDVKVAVFVKKEYAPDRSGLVGAPGKEYWTFRAVAPGRTTIDLHYVRPWQNRQKAVDAASYEIIVK